MNSLLIIAAVVLALIGSGCLFVFALWLIRRWQFAANQHPREWLRTIRGKGHAIEELASRIGMSVEELTAIRPQYHEAWIPRRSGGTRRLDIPDRTTKAVQRRLLVRVFARLRAHPAAVGFESGRSIVDAARPHAFQAIVVRMDVVNFFTSTTAKRLEHYFRRIGWNREAAALLVRLTTYDGGLPQGAPTSPRLSNLVNYLLDVQLSNLAQRRRAVYTRYADDITLSFRKSPGRRVRGTIQSVRRILNVFGYRIHKRRKYSIRRAHQQQEVLGLVVNQGVRLPRKTRRWLRAVRHHHATGRPATLSASQLAGWLAFEQMVATQADG